MPDDQLFFPEGVAVDAVGNIVVTDAYNGRLSAFRPVGFEGALTEDHWFVKAMLPNGAARGHRALPAQIAIAWVLAQGDDIVPIPGTKQRKYIEQNAAAVDVKLSADEIALLSKAFPPNVTAGTRYPEKQLKGLGI